MCQYFVVATEAEKATAAGGVWQGRKEVQGVQVLTVDQTRCDSDG